MHTAAWPTSPTPARTRRRAGCCGAVSEALIGIRRAKTDAKASQKTDVVSATIAGPALLRAGPRRPQGGRPHRDRRVRRGGHRSRCATSCSRRRLNDRVRDIREADRDDVAPALHRLRRLLRDRLQRRRARRACGHGCMDAESEVCAVVAADDGDVVGFAHYRRCPTPSPPVGTGSSTTSTWSRRPAASGAATALIDAVAERAASDGGGTLRWITAADNATRAARLRPRRDPHDLGHLREDDLMQLGTRWNVGDEPPATLPDAVLAAIARCRGRARGRRRPTGGAGRSRGSRGDPWSSSTTARSSASTMTGDVTVEETDLGTRPAPAIREDGESCTGGGARTPVLYETVLVADRPGLELWGASISATRATRSAASCSRRCGAAAWSLAVCSSWAIAVRSARLRAHMSIARLSRMTATVEAVRPGPAACAVVAVIVFTSSLVSKLRLPPTFGGFVGRFEQHRHGFGPLSGRRGFSPSMTGKALKWIWTGREPGQVLAAVLVEVSSMTAVHAR